MMEEDEAVSENNNVDDEEEEDKEENTANEYQWLNPKTDERPYTFLKEWGKNKEPTWQLTVN